MYALYDGPTDFRFNKLDQGDIPLYEGTSDTIRLPMSRFMSPSDASRACHTKSQTPKPRSFVFVAWREDERGSVSVGFSSDPVFRAHSREAPAWFGR